MDSGKSKNLFNGIQLFRETIKKLKIRQKGSDSLENKKQSPYRAMALVSIISSQLAGSVLIGVFLGIWIDKKIGTMPLFLILGIFLGLAIGVYATIKTIHSFTNND